MADRYDEIGDRIEKTVEGVMEKVMSGVERGLSAGRRAMEEAEKNAQNRSAEEPVRDLKDVDRGNTVTNSTSTRSTGSSDYINQKFRPPQLYANASVMKRGSVAGTVFGYGLAVVSGVGASAFIWNLILGAAGPGNLIFGAASCGIAFLLGMVIGSFNTVKTLRISRFQAYMEALGEKTMMSFQELAERTGRSPRYVKNDIIDMKERKYFRQAHVSSDEQSLITADETWKRYRSYEEYQKEQKAMAEEEENLLREKGMTSAGIQIVREGEQYLQKIQRLNAEIPDEAMTAKLQKLETAIFDLLTAVKKQPGKAGELRKTMNYYLPTIEKLIRTYIETSRSGDRTEEALKTQAEIETTVDTLSDAFTQLLRKLETNRKWDVSADITVLNQMLSLEGLKDDDIKK